VETADALRKLLVEIKAAIPDFLAVLTANVGGKPFVAIGISDAVLGKIKKDATSIIKEHVTPLIKGGGGGQKNMATAGGQDASRLAEIIPLIRKML
jgi:alanyl-tRNA synthetase